MSVEAIKKEMQRFHDALPTLMKTLENRWIVFQSGEVVSDHNSEDEAFASALEAFGATGVYVIVKVEEAEPIRMNAASAFLYG